MTDTDAHPRKPATMNVVGVRHVRDYVLWLRFSDGTEREVDLGPELDGPVFEPLRDVERFRMVSVNPELRTITWPNGADFAPEFLHDLTRTS
jgi:hypothetical protein